MLISTWEDFFFETFFSPHFSRLKGRNYTLAVWFKIAQGGGPWDSGAVTSKAENRAGLGPEASRVVTSKATHKT